MKRSRNGRHWRVWILIGQLSRKENIRGGGEYRCFGVPPGASSAGVGEPERAKKNITIEGEFQRGLCAVPLYI